MYVRRPQPIAPWAETHPTWSVYRWTWPAEVCPSQRARKCCISHTTSWRTSDNSSKFSSLSLPYFLARRLLQNTLGKSHSSRAESTFHPVLSKIINSFINRWLSFLKSNFLYFNFLFPGLIYSDSFAIINRVQIFFSLSEIFWKLTIKSDLWVLLLGKK